MSQAKKSVIPFLIIMLLFFLVMDFGNGEIKYEQVNYENLPEEYKQNLLNIGPGGVGMFQLKGHTYAFIATKPNEKAEILFVGDAEDGIGHEVRYKIVKIQNIDETKIIDGHQEDYSLYLIRLEKVVSTPFGFNNINL